MTTYTPREPYVGAYGATGRVEEDPRSLGDLFSDLTQNASLLARQEVQLAKVEMQEKAKEAGGEIAIIGAGAALGNAALLALTAAAVLGLSLYMSPWLAALVVALVLGVIAGLLIWQGVSALKEMTMVPEQTVATLKEDKEWLSRQMN
jgi:hypothetical protein